MSNKRFLCLLFLILPAFLFSQTNKKPLTHEVVSDWNEIESPRISNNGQWVCYSLQPIEGDGKTILFNAANPQEWIFERGADPVFSSDNQFLVFKIKPHQDSIRQMKITKVDKKDWPQDTLAVLNLATKDLQKFPYLQSFKLPEKWAGWLVAHFDAKAHAEEDLKKDKNGPLIIWDLQNNKEYRIPQATDYVLAEKTGKMLLSTKDKKLSSVRLLDTGTAAFTDIWSDSLDTKSLSMDPQGNQVAFLTLEEKEAESVALHHWTGSTGLQTIANADSDFLNDSWHISEHASPRFKEDGSQLFFGIAQALPQKDENILDEELPIVEVWNYKDERTYPMQKVELDRDKRKYYPCVVNTQSGKITQLGSEAIPNVSIDTETPSPYVVGYSDDGYLRQTSWEGGPSYRNVFLINTNTGRATPMVEKVRGQVRLSPAGKYLYWYSLPDSSWYIHSIERRLTKNITEGLDVPFYDEINDQPDFPYPYGIAGWSTDDDFVYLYDRYDIWQFDPMGNINPVNLFKGRDGRRVHRYVKTDPEASAIEEVEPMLIHFTDEETKAEGYMWFNIHTGVKDILQEGDFSLSRRPIKARNADRWLFTREDYQTFPDLLYSTDLKSTLKISDANPQKQDYHWGNIEMIEFTSLDGQQLKGLLVKPDNFDPSKKYPLMVNFYEKSSNRLHRHRAPEFNRSTMNYPFYASRGYVVFNPDVPYKIGYPGESAYNSVIAGVTHLVNQGFIDEERIGLQGHSWGGYQIAYLLTRSDMFACAESGAPVVNMISAYGGIRWGSGMSRQFQYEHTQSRIGGTIWDYPLRYIENSPIFTMDKVKTPVLILHNDNDSAVPWYQGIEYFMALRRLNKPAWMLNYNDEPHWPLKLPNRKDFQKRMQQFFDYYLLDAPMPEWMDEGVPALEKETNMGYEPADKN
jgi:dienelactone hydrolase